jgi:hypothetical protein
MQVYKCQVNGKQRYIIATQRGPFYIGLVSRQKREKYFVYEEIARTFEGLIIKQYVQTYSTRASAMRALRRELPSYLALFDFSDE